jgi:hypothetical protein
MFRRIANSILIFFREETLYERSERMLPGVIIGIIVGTAYVLTLHTINVISLPALHLSLDWGRMVANLVIYDLVLGLVGAIAGWFTEDYMGAIGGGIVTIVIYLIINWIIIRFTGNNADRIVQLLISALPLLVGAILLCGVYRFSFGRYLRLKQTQPSGKRRARLAGLIAIVILAGLLPGLFSRFDQNAQNVVLTMDERLQAVGGDPTLMAQFPLAEFPTLQGHFGMHFVLYPRVSGSIAGSLDVTIRYDDGYSITCLVPTADPYVQYFKQCFPGNNVNLP